MTILSEMIDDILHWMFKFLRLDQKDYWIIPFTITSSALSVLATLTNGYPRLVIGLTGIIGILFSTYLIYIKYYPKKAFLHFINCILLILVFFGLLTLREAI